MGLREKKIEKETKAAAVLAESLSAYSLPTDFEESVELDVIERLKSNISMLEDLSLRLRFMNNELEGILGTKNLLKDK